MTENTFIPLDGGAEFIGESIDSIYCYESDFGTQICRPEEYAKWGIAAFARPEVRRLIRNETDLNNYLYDCYNYGVGLTSTLQSVIDCDRLYDIQPTNNPFYSTVKGDKCSQD